MGESPWDAENAVLRTGYDPEFLGTPVGVPALGPGMADDALLWEGSLVIDYTHFSLCIGRSRRLARWVGWNINGGGIKLLPRANLGFTKDPRVPAAAQTGNELYNGNRLDRGHLARRGDLLWSGMAQGQAANRDSFSYTNIAPQMEGFNQSRQDRLWGSVENALYADVEVQDLRVSVLAGPVFHGDDRLSRGVGLPAEHWKVLVFEGARGAEAAGLRADPGPGAGAGTAASGRVPGMPARRCRMGGPHAAAVLGRGHPGRFPARGAGCGVREPLSTAPDIAW